MLLCTFPHQLLSRSLLSPLPNCCSLLPLHLSVRSGTLIIQKVWYDNRADDLTKEGMLKGIEDAAAFILFLSSGVLERPYCQMEIRHALALKKPVVLLHGERDERSIATGDACHSPTVLSQRATRGTAPSTSAPPMPPRPPTCRSSSISTSRCRSGGEGTSATGC